MDRNEKIVKNDEYKNKIRLDVCQSKIYTSHIQHGITSEMKSHHEKGVQEKSYVKCGGFMTRSLAQMFHLALVCKKVHPMRLLCSATRCYPTN